MTMETDGAAAGARIPETEIVLEFSRSSGPGGQHVNKTETRVTAVWDLHASEAVSEDERRRIGERLGSRISKEGLLRVSCGRSRSQADNRAEAIERLQGLVAEALEPEKPRRPTPVPTRTRRARLAGKRHRGRLKQERARPEVEEP